MSKAFSSKKPLPPAPSATSFAKTAQRKKKSPRSSLQDLNRIFGRSNSNDSSSISTETPRGCLKFLLSNSSSSSTKNPIQRPKSLSKTPISASNAPRLKQSKSDPSKENLPKNSTGENTIKLTSDKAQKFKKNPPGLYPWQSGKKSGRRSCQKSKPCSILNDHGSKPEKLKQQQDSPGGMIENAGELAELKSCKNDSNLIPLSKKAMPADLGVRVVDENVEESSSRSKSRTPPIQSSVSPEIQCGSLSLTTTPACYGAGYVVSGVTDRRKCRPRGILIVEENNFGFNEMAGERFDDEKKIMVADDNVSDSLLPLPTEASMRWLSSPQKVEKDPSVKSEDRLDHVQGLAESTSPGFISTPLSGHETFWDTSDNSGLSNATNGVGRKMFSSISPTGQPEFQALWESTLSPSYLPVYFSPNSTTSCKFGSSEKRQKNQSNIINENSPSSLSLSSGNVIETPQSNYSSDLHVGLSWLRTGNSEENNSNPDLVLINEIPTSSSLVLNRSGPLADSVSSSFQFDCLPMPCDSIDLRKFPQFLDDQNPRLSGSTTGSTSLSQMRISWREGLMSQIYEQDEFDCCRCLSDEEDLANDYSSKKIPNPYGPEIKTEVDDNRKLNNDVGTTENEDNELGFDRFGNEMFPALIHCLGIESINTNGGDLVASKDDSDWNLWYKNNLFKV